MAQLDSCITLTELSASNLPKEWSYFDNSDGYVKASYTGVDSKPLSHGVTEHINNTANPKWTQEIIFDLKGKPLNTKGSIKIEIWDHDHGGAKANDFIGCASILTKGLTNGKACTQTKELKTKDGKSVAGCNVSMKILYKYKPPPGKKKRAAKAKAKKKAALKDDMGEAIPCSEEDDYAADDGVEDDGVEDDGVESETGGKTKRTRKIRAPLSTQAQDFQVRIKIVEARGLEGGDLSPVCRINCLGENEETKPKSTSQPVWNEIFYFTTNMSPAEIVREQFCVGVYNARRFRFDSLIGQFRCDFGVPYDRSGHTVTNKWLLLSGKEKSDTGVRGYLKVCIAVLGPGDPAPSFKEVSTDESDDIESNMLMPAGTVLHPASFTINIYSAEDLPRMDDTLFEDIKRWFGYEGKEAKQLTDPYVYCTFAGKDKETSVEQSTNEPEWNEAIKLGFSLPSVAEKLQFQIYDWDTFSDDIIATHSLSIDQMGMSAAKGKCVRKPTFGPCYVNFYGSVREFCRLTDEYNYLNDGKGEGIAYRGRMLIEVITNSEKEKFQSSLEDIQAVDINRVRTYMGARCKYALHMVMFEATLMESASAPIEFEVSIGPYGNKYDETVAACVSSSQPTNTVYDGCKYYYLPWEDEKPCIAIDSSWEDVSFRMEGVNAILGIVRKLESNLSRLRVGIKDRLDESVLHDICKQLLKNLEEDCRVGLRLPKLDKLANKLDHRIQDRRKDDLKNIRGDIDLLLKRFAAEPTTGGASTSQSTSKKESIPALDTSKTKSVPISLLDEVLKDVANFLVVLKHLAKDPQASIPDVFIWMLEGTKRVAYYRIPAHEIFYSDNRFTNKFTGVNCAKLQSIVFKYPGHEQMTKSAIPGMLRMKMWFGRKEHENLFFTERGKLGKSVVMAETYENQAFAILKWSDSVPTRPSWSDIHGQEKLTKDAFKVPPNGWEFDGDWMIRPELSLLVDPDAALGVYTETFYKLETRVIGGPWQEIDEWTNSEDRKVKVGVISEVKIPTGWKWDQSRWIQDENSGDSEGWEYCIRSDMRGGGWTSVEKRFHLYKRKKWTRRRALKDTESHQVKRIKKRKENCTDKDYGWEYAFWFNFEFHSEDHFYDLARRKRWHRRMTRIDGAGDKDCCFGSKKVEKDGEKPFYGSAPRMVLEITDIKAKCVFQLRAYIYQARDLPAADSDSLSDPYAIVSFSDKSARTAIVNDSLNPNWDQTLKIVNLTLFGDKNEFFNNPPNVCVEVYDDDSIFMKDDFLGRCYVTPVVKLSKMKVGVTPLKWHSMTMPHLKKPAGGILGSFELIEITGGDLVSPPPKLDEHKTVMDGFYSVPSEIRPVHVTMTLKALFWGVRDMKRFHLLAVDSPFVKLEVGGKSIMTGIIKDAAKNPNFPVPEITVTVSLPKEAYFRPPLTMIVMDDRMFGATTVGTCVATDLKKYMCSDKPVTPKVKTTPKAVDVDHADTVLITMDEIPNKETKSKEDISWWSKYLTPKTEPALGKADDDDKMQKKRADDEEDINWWTKYYASNSESALQQPFDYDRIQVHKCRLEDVAAYQGFTDFCDTFQIMSGMDDDAEDEPDVIGELKASFRFYPEKMVPPKRKFPPSGAVECVVRLYCIRANDLKPMDPNGLADPYLWIKVGDHDEHNSDEYIPNTLKPVFGKMFQFKVTLPLHKDLKIIVMDYDMLTPDDTIGQTIVDLEDRFLSKYRGTCGLPLTYCKTGPDKWRDAVKPKKILDRYCKREGLTISYPEKASSATIGKKTYSLEEFERGIPTNPHWGVKKQRLALHVLHSFGLVKEHVETRPLRNPVQPGFDQGNLEMWVDIFPNIPGEPTMPPGAPVIVTPPKPKKYILRCVIYNAVEVPMDEVSLLGGDDKMADIYVKGWLPGGEKQSTDVHYRSMDGEGNFNWRFVFPFDYDTGEKKIVYKAKEHFWNVDAREQRRKPKLTIQIYENDVFTPDDFIGELHLNLNDMFEPEKTSKKCRLSMVDEGAHEKEKEDADEEEEEEEDTKEDEAKGKQENKDKKGVKKTKKRCCLCMTDQVAEEKEEEDDEEDGKFQEETDKGKQGKGDKKEVFKEQTLKDKKAVQKTSKRCCLPRVYEVAEEEKEEGDEDEETQVDGDKGKQEKGGKGPKSKEQTRNRRGTDEEQTRNRRGTDEEQTRQDKKDVQKTKKRCCLCMVDQVAEEKEEEDEEKKDNRKPPEKQDTGKQAKGVKGKQDMGKQVKGVKGKQDIGKQVKGEKGTTVTEPKKADKKAAKNRKVSLFKQKKFKGFWPCSIVKNGTRRIRGKVEMELELVDEKEAAERPAAVARDEPNMNPKLDPPKRPDTSFSWFSSPWKSCKFIIWRHNKGKIIGLLMLIFAILLVAISIYTVPGAAWSAFISETIRGAFSTAQAVAANVVSKK